ncbi:hypothetical protein DPEC_G00164000 [Dallia pectoralis]|uniref:Uncharacterized protein n=1 Tax=Dallia pectoralis TaxID=75939 RepID=A0ACC2GHB8_DALPE|nr:hypothetical protein DPEC_G00164000 [Dallia pectoralis]
MSPAPIRRPGGALWEFRRSITQRRKQFLLPIRAHTEHRSRVQSAGSSLQGLSLQSSSLQSSSLQDSSLQDSSLQSSSLQSSSLQSSSLQSSSLQGSRSLDLQSSGF